MTSTNRRQTCPKLLRPAYKTGIQYGHKPREWNPKMAPYLLSEHYGFHLFDLVKTAKLLEFAGNFLEKIARKGKKILFVGTTQAASSSVAKYAKKSGSFYINYRWLGGMITNWPTLEKRITKLKELEHENEQGKFEKLTKKEANKKRKTLKRLKALFEGIQEMNSLPDFVIFTSQVKQKLAIQECHKLGILTMCIVDSNCDPSLSPYIIPANDDAPGGIEFILSYLTEKIELGKNSKNSNEVTKRKYTTFPNKKIRFKEKLFPKKSQNKKTLKN